MVVPWNIRKLFFIPEATEICITVFYIQEKVVMNNTNYGNPSTPKKESFHLLLTAPIITISDFPIFVENLRLL